MSYETEKSRNFQFKRLDQVAEIIMGQSPSSNNYNIEKIGLPLIQGNADIHQRNSNPRIYTSQITKTSRPGDILISVRAPVGTIAKSNHDAVIGRGIAVIRPFINEQFVYQYLLRVEDAWTKVSQGSTFRAINRDELRKLLIPYPPLPEQKKIAEILSTWDEAITKLEDLIAGAEKYQQSVVSKILSKRNIQFAHQDEWKEVPLGELIELVSERTTINNQYPILTSSRKGIFLQEDYFKKSVASSNNIGYKIIKNGEFTYRAMSDDGTFKFNRLLEHEIGIVSPAYSVFKATRVEPRFLHLYMNSHIFTKEIAKSSQGGTRLSLKYTALAKFKLSIPNKKWQIEIANLNDDIEHYIITLKEYKAQLIIQKQGLMQRLLTGKIRVKLD